MNFNNKFGKRRNIRRKCAQLIGLLSVLEAVFAGNSALGMNNQRSKPSHKLETIPEEPEFDNYEHEHSRENIYDYNKYDDNVDAKPLKDIGKKASNNYFKENKDQRGKSLFGNGNRLDSFGIGSVGKGKGKDWMIEFPDSNQFSKSKPFKHFDAFESGRLLDYLPGVADILKINAGEEVDISPFTTLGTYFRADGDRMLRLSVGRDKNGYLHILATSIVPEHVKSALSKLIIHESIVKKYITLLKECCPDDCSPGEILKDFILNTAMKLLDIRLNSDSNSWDVLISRELYSFLSNNLPKNGGDLKKIESNSEKRSNNGVDNDFMLKDDFDDGTSINDYGLDSESGNFSFAKSKKSSENKGFGPRKINIKLNGKLDNNQNSRQAYSAEVDFEDDELSYDKLEKEISNKRSCINKADMTNGSEVSENAYLSYDDSMNEYGEDFNNNFSFDEPNTSSFRVNKNNVDTLKNKKKQKDFKGDFDLERGDDVVDYDYSKDSSIQKKKLNNKNVSKSRSKLTKTKLNDKKSPLKVEDKKSDLFDSEEINYDDIENYY